MKTAQWWHPRLGGIVLYEIFRFIERMHKFEINEEAESS